MRIEVTDLSFSAGKKRILNGVSAVFEGRRVYGIIGPNGCGKTTLLKHIYRQYPARGHIRVDGRPLESYSGREYACGEILSRYCERQAAEQLFDVLKKNYAKITPLRAWIEETVRGHQLLSFIVCTVVQLLHFIQKPKNLGT